MAWLKPYHSQSLTPALCVTRHRTRSKAWSRQLGWSTERFSALLVAHTVTMDARLKSTANLSSWISSKVSCKLISPVACASVASMTCHFRCRMENTDVHPRQYLEMLLGGELAITGTRRCAFTNALNQSDFDCLLFGNSQILLLENGFKKVTCTPLQVKTILGDALLAAWRPRPTPPSSATHVVASAATMAAAPAAHVASAAPPSHTNTNAVGSGNAAAICKKN